MRVGEAQDIAAAWVEAHAAELPGFAGAFFSGSTVWRHRDTELPAASDVDVLVVTTTSPPPAGPGKVRVDGVTIDIGHVTWDEIGSAEQVLGTYHLAACFRRRGAIADPTGRLAALRTAVLPRFGEPVWVLRRCEDAERRIVNRLDRLDVLTAAGAEGAEATGSASAMPTPDQVTSWLFATGVTTHVLLTAAQRNPTVRLRYPAVRELLYQRGRERDHERLLSLLGCARLDAARVTRRLDAMAAAFDAAAEVSSGTYFFAADITPEARHVAVDASRELIDQGLHREAVFWIAATHTRCAAILARDAPAALRDAHAAGFRALLADLGVGTTPELARRGRRVRRYLPELRRTRDRLITRP